MSRDKKNILKSSTGVATATMLSRILGLVRTVLTAHIIGGGTLMSAWGMTFTIGNFFRRILGEGALGTALIPMISHIIEKGGREDARKKLTAIFVALGAVLALLCIITGAISILLEPYVELERLKLMLMACPVIMPYTFFICLVGVAGSILNSVNRFFIPALGALFMNVALIVCILFVCPLFQGDFKSTMYALSVAVVISGILQLMLNGYLLYREGMFPPLTLSFSKESMATLKELWHLTLPGIIGASALQISLVVDRALAMFLSDYAVPALIYSDRIIYLPIGVFAVSFGAVSLSMMSRSAANGRITEMLSSFSFAFRQLIFICVPIAFFVFVFREEIIKILFVGGNFGEIELKETAYAMMFYSAGIPAFAALKISTASFQARKEMRTPVKVSILCICVNIVLSVILMWHLKQGGIALATVISSFLNNFILLFLLKKEFPEISYIRILRTFILTIGISLLASYVATATYNFIPETTVGLFNFLPTQLLHFIFAGVIFITTYTLLSMLLKCDEIGELFELLLKKNNSTPKTLK